MRKRRLTNINPIEFNQIRASYGDYNVDEPMNDEIS